jgi:hypothetical protein
MSSIDQILEKATATETDLQTLIQSTKDVSDLIKPWTNIEAHHPEVEGTLSDMQFGMTEYSSSVNASLDAVHLVQAYAAIGEELCDHLKNNDEKMIADAITRMKGIAEQCEEQANKAVKMFRSNRRKLNRLRSAIPIANDRLLVAQKRHETEKVFVPTITPFNVVKSKWYNMNVVMPASWMDAAKLFVVPIVQTISASRENTAKAHEKMYNTCVKAGKQLDDSLSVLEKVAKHTEKLSAYCLEIGERVGDLHDLVEDLQTETINRTKMVALRAKWTAVKEAHGEYKRELGPPQEIQEITSVEEVPEIPEVQTVQDVQPVQQEQEVQEPEESQECPPYTESLVKPISPKEGHGPQKREFMLPTPPRESFSLPGSYTHDSPIRQQLLLL